MSLGVAILCGIIYWLAEANLPFVGLWTLQRPLVCGFLTGCLLGQPVTGAVAADHIALFVSLCIFKYQVIGLNHFLHNSFSLLLFIHVSVLCLLRLRIT